MDLQAGQVIFELNTTNLTQTVLQIIQTIAILTTVVCTAVFGFLNNKRQQDLFIKQQEEERKRWINDTYAKAEAERWIKFYGQFYSASADFLETINHLNISSLYEKDPVLEFKEKFEQYFELWKLTEEMNPYFEKVKNLDFSEIRGLIRNIMFFYEKVSEELYKRKIEYKKDEFPSSKDRYSISVDEKAKIKKELTWSAMGLYKTSYDADQLLKTDGSITEKQLSEIIEKYENDINKILNELSKKLTGHKSEAIQK